MRPTVSASLGTVVWLIGLVWFRPSPFDVAWAKALLLLAVLVLVPLGLQLIRPATLSAWAIRLQPVGAACLVAAFLLPAGWPAALLALPWLTVCGLIALSGLRSWRTRNPATTAGMVYLPVGAVWAIADRAELRPLDFEPVIVLLTAIHFHYAGFLLPLITGLATDRSQIRIAVWPVILGVPAVAVGITASQLGAMPAIECAAAWLMTVGGWLTAFVLFRCASDVTVGFAARISWAIASLSLIFTMALAALYGSREFIDVAWLDIPWMRALHGSVNVLGFGVCGLLGWYSVQQTGERRASAR